MSPHQLKLQLAAEKHRYKLNRIDYYVSLMLRAACVVFAFAWASMQSYYTYELFVLLGLNIALLMIADYAVQDARSRYQDSLRKVNSLIKLLHEAELAEG